MFCILSGFLFGGFMKDLSILEKVVSIKSYESPSEIIGYVKDLLVSKVEEIIIVNNKEDNKENMQVRRD